MTDTEINEAIALYLGWKKHERNVECDDGYQWTEKVVTWTSPDGRFWIKPNRYCEDLNAMHEAEKAMTLHSQWSDYRRWLANSISATARHRAESFLRVIGKWRDE